MKTKELIQQLQENDPEGETEVCVGNTPIHYVDNLPAYYDGKLQVLIFDPALEPYYSVVGAKIVSSGRKVNIHLWGVDDAIHSNPDLPVDVENDMSGEYSYAKRIEGWREEGREIQAFASNLKLNKHKPSEISICSEHMGKKDENCPLCKIDPEEVLPGFREKNIEARKAGLTKCECGFSYYKITPGCPRCGKRRL